MSSNFLDVDSLSSSSPTTPEAERLYYIPCSFCNFILVVSVPCSRIFEVVTVRCGHCANLWSINMGDALHSLSASRQHQLPHNRLRSFPSLLQYPQQHQLQQLAGFPQHQFHNQDLLLQVSGAAPAANCALEFAAANSAPVHTFYNNFSGGSIRIPMAGRGVEERSPFGRPPAKKQRVPSAYNKFVKEEIRRIKAINPEISHREAFSTAAKNWAHFPHIQFGLMLESDIPSKAPENYRPHLSEDNRDSCMNPGFK